MVGQLPGLLGTEGLLLAVELVSSALQYRAEGVSVLRDTIALSVERALGLFAGGLFQLISALLAFLLERFVIVMGSLIVHGDVLRVSETSPEL
tara:strand:- start:944 stop:1222 length:279 start_codon:yes stop_codon:yes gene_type:complete